MLDETTRNDRVKGFFNRLENQGTLHGLYREFNIPANQSTDVGRMNVRLDNGEMFRLRDFVNVQEARTKWLWERRPQMDNLIRQASIRERPQSTLRSYCNQECEGISREAKQRWADWEGHTWISREHDGLVVGLSHGTTLEDAEREATDWASKALGYAQTVTATKPCQLQTQAPHGNGRGKHYKRRLHSYHPRERVNGSRKP